MSTLDSSAVTRRPRGPARTRPTALPPAASSSCQLADAANAATTNTADAAAGLPAEHQRAEVDDRRRVEQGQREQPEVGPPGGGQSPVRAGGPARVAVVPPGQGGGTHGECQQHDGGQPAQRGGDRPDQPGDGGTAQGGERGVDPVGGRGAQARPRADREGGPRGQAEDQHRDRPDGDRDAVPGEQSGDQRLGHDGEPAGWAPGARPISRRSRGNPRQTLKPKARNCSRPSSVILSGPHGGIQTQLIRMSCTSPPPGPLHSASRAWSSMTSVSGQAAEVSVMSTVATSSSSM